MASEKNVYAVDPHHGGIRLAVLGSMAVGFLLGAFVVVPLLLDLFNVDVSSGLIIGILGGTLMTIPASWVTEEVLIQVWPSGRYIAVEGDTVRLHEPDEEIDSVELNIAECDVFSWRFVVDQRRAKVPRGWYCLSLRLMRGKQFITPYAFMKAEQAKTVPHFRQFRELISKKVAEQPGNAALMDIYQTQHHLRSAEDDRWLIGAEMEPDAFIEFVRLMDDKNPNWP